MALNSGVAVDELAADLVSFDGSSTIPPFVSTNVQDAIVEVANAAFNSSKAFLLCNYGGNANSGRYLEFFAGIDSSQAPIYVPNPYKGITIVARSVGVATCVLRVVDISSGSPVMLYNITFAAATTVVVNSTPTSPLFTTGSNAQIAVLVQSGSINKPHFYIVGQGG